MTLREKMIRETEEFLETELSRDTIPCEIFGDKEEALFFVVEESEELLKVS